MVLAKGLCFHCHVVQMCYICFINRAECLPHHVSLFTKSHWTEVSHFYWRSTRPVLYKEETLCLLVSIPHQIQGKYCLPFKVFLFGLVCFFCWLVGFAFFFQLCKFFFTVFGVRIYPGFIGFWNILPKNPYIWIRAHPSSGLGNVTVVKCFSFKKVLF